MNWYLTVKFLHITTAMLTIGGIFARQLVRGLAKKSVDVNEVASLTQAALRMDRTLIIPSSNVMVLMGIILAVMQKWPMFGFLQGASQNWLLVSNVLFVIVMGIIFIIVVPHNKRVDAKLQAALTKGNVTPELMAELEERRNKFAHLVEESLLLVVVALMVFKPF